MSELVRCQVHTFTVGNLNSRNEPLKVRSRILNIQQSRSRLHMRIRDNHHNVRVGRKGVNKGCKSRIANLHTLKLYETLEDNRRNQS
jgi:hypothetical protein